MTWLFTADGKLNGAIRVADGKLNGAIRVADALSKVNNTFVDAESAS